MANANIKDLVNRIAVKSTNLFNSVKSKLGLLNALKVDNGTTNTDLSTMDGSTPEKTIASVAKVLSSGSAGDGLGKAIDPTATPIPANTPVFITFGNLGGNAGLVVKTSDVDVPVILPSITTLFTIDPTHGTVTLNIAKITVTDTFPYTTSINPATAVLLGTLVGSDQSQVRQKYFKGEL